MVLIQKAVCDSRTSELVRDDEELLHLILLAVLYFGNMYDRSPVNGYEDG